VDDFSEWIACFVSSNSVSDVTFFSNIFVSDSISHLKSRGR
jgi:hypothetical protein